MGGANATSVLCCPPYGGHFQFVIDCSEQRSDKLKSYRRMNVTKITIGSSNKTSSIQILTNYERISEGGELGEKEKEKEKEKGR